MGKSAPLLGIYNPAIMETRCIQEPVCNQNGGFGAVALHQGDKQAERFVPPQCWTARSRLGGDSKAGLGRGEAGRSKVVSQGEHKCREHG